MTEGWLENVYCHCFPALNTLGSARGTALKRLLRTPAPDLPALALKIELVVNEEVATLAGGERCLAVLKADGLRVAAIR